MKRLFVLSSLLVATGTALAANQEQNVGVVPKMYLSILDTSSKVARDIGSREYSVSNKNLQLCWSVRDMPFLLSNHVIEVFIAPDDKGKFVNAGARVSKSDNVHSIHSIKQAINNEEISSCWSFDDTDPLGKYTLELQVNDLLFKGVQFELVK